jgi:hypothetical protein
MRLLSVRIGSYDTGIWYEISYKIDNKVWESLKVKVKQDNLVRGVLVKEIILIERIKKNIIEKVKYFNNRIYHQAKNSITNFLLKLLLILRIISQERMVEVRKSFIIIQKEDLINIETKKTIVSLKPENNFYEGFIIHFSAFCSHNTDCNIELYSTNEEFVISNQTNFEIYNEYHKRSHKSSLIVIHGPENLSLVLEAYYFGYKLEEKTGYLKKFNLILEPTQVDTISPVYMLKTVSNSDQHLTIHPEYFSFLMSQTNEVIKDVFNIINDSDTNQQYLDIYLQQSKLNCLDNNYTYSSKSII